MPFFLPPFLLHWDGNYHAVKWKDGKRKGSARLWLAASRAPYTMKHPDSAVPEWGSIYLWLLELKRSCGGLRIFWSERDLACLSRRIRLWLSKQRRYFIIIPTALHCTLLKTNPLLYRCNYPRYKWVILIGQIRDQTVPFLRIRKTAFTISAVL